jgi:hypothetical protein
LLIRDNLGKRREVDDKTCLFYGEEYVYHLFFDCVVAKQAWSIVSSRLSLTLSLWPHVGYVIPNFELLTAVCWSLETEESDLFRGGCLGEYESTVAAGAIHVEMLESSHNDEGFSWLRRRDQ